MLNDKTILITGGTGSFGTAFTEYCLKNYSPRKIIIFSRDEFKQYQMREKFRKYDDCIRYFIGDVRDKSRLSRAFVDVDYIVHAAALKHVSACEYNPIEAVKTNIEGAENIINVAIDRGVKKIVALSTDKAVNPDNLYGATKLVSDKLFIAGNSYSGVSKTLFSVVRYGNVLGSRGSVIPFFDKLINAGEKLLPITDKRMTRFWISHEEGIELVLRALREEKGGKIFIAKIPSFKVVDLAKAMLTDVEIKEIGIRSGEKLHEDLISDGDSRSTYEYDAHFEVFPNYDWIDFDAYYNPLGKKVIEGFEYSSSNPELFLTIDELKVRIKNLT